MIKGYKRLLDEYVKDNFKLDPEKSGDNNVDSSTKRKIKASKKKNTIVINPEYEGAYTGNF